MAYSDDQDELDQQRQQRQPNQAVDYSGYAGYTNPAPPQPAQAPASPQPATPPPTQQPVQGQYDRNQFRDAWMASGGRTTQDLQNFVAQHQGDYGAGVQILPGGKGDRIRLPDGTLIDAVIGAGVGGQGAGWTGDPSQMGGGAPGAGGQGAPGSTAGGGISAATQDPMVNELLNTLKARSNQTLNINAATDPNIRQQADAYSAQQERARRQYLAEQAERQGPNANLTNEERLSAEQAGQASGGFEASLIGNEIQARRQEIQDALTSMQGMLTDQQKMNLQQQLAQLDDATKRYGIQTQANTAQAQISNDWQKALLNNDQFNADLGLRAEDDYNRWNQAFSQ